MLTHWTRDRTRGPRLPLEAVVRRQTSETAGFFGFTDRGRLAPGLKARYEYLVKAICEKITPLFTQRFPAVLIARSLGFSEETYYEVEAAVRDAGAPKVDFSG